MRGSISPFWRRRRAIEPPTYHPHQPLNSRTAEFQFLVDQTAERLSGLYGIAIHIGVIHLMINLFVEFLSILNAMYGEDPTVSFVQRAKDFGITGGLRPRDTAGGLAVSRWTVAKGVRDLGMRSYVRRYPSIHVIHTHVY